MRLVNRDFTFLWAGQLVSQVGDFVFSTTLSLWVGTILLQGRSYAPAAVSALIAVVAVGTLLAGPVAGVFVDRWDRRRTMLGADLVRAGLIGALTVVAFLPDGTLSSTAVLVLVYVTVLLATCAAQFFNPARFALLGDVVELRERGRAAGIGKATQAIATISGPPLAAPLLLTAGIRWALLLNGLSFAASFAAVRAVRTRPQERTRATATGFAGIRRKFASGLRLVRGSRVVTVLLVTLSLVTIGTSALNSLNVFFVTENLGAESRWFGTLEMALGCGLVVGALGAGRLGARLGFARVFSLGLVLTGVGLVAYARTTSLWPALVVLAVVGLPVAAVNTALTPVLLKAVPQSHLGRVVAVIGPVQQVAALTGVAVSGWLASTALQGLDLTVGGVHFGRIDSVFIVAGLIVAAGGLYAPAALRGTDRTDDAPDPVGTAVPDSDTGEGIAASGA
jgi:MFS family permease